MLVVVSFEDLLVSWRRQTKQVLVPGASTELETVEVRAILTATDMRQSRDQGAKAGREEDEKGGIQQGSNGDGIEITCMKDY